MPVHLCLPEDRTEHGIIVCMHAPGVDSFIEAMMQRLADAGLAAYAPDFYHRQEEQSADPMVRLSRLRDAELEADLMAVHRFAVRQGHPSLAMVGFCMGGRIALIGASALKPLAASVSFYGGFIRESWGAGTAPPIERVASMDCPLLLIGGLLDTNPSPQDMSDLSDALRLVNKAHELEMYEGVGHAFLNFNRPGYRKDTAMRAWHRCEQFLKQHLCTRGNPVNRSFPEAP